MITLDQGGRRRGSVRVLAPPPSLRDVAELIWIDSTPGVPETGGWRVVADDAPHLVYSVVAECDRERARLTLVGARTVHTDIHVANRRLTMGVRLRPGALPALFGIGARELTDRGVSFDAVSPKLAGRVLDRIQRMSLDDGARELGRLLEQIVMRGRTLDRRAHFLNGLPAHRAHDVRSIAADFGISDRALRAWSAAHLGIGVRRYLRIRRLHAALELRMATPRLRWSTVAARAGYADQPHLVRDCKELLGETPAAFVARR